MSLQVWLPLINNINNQGISNINVLNHNITFQEGKFKQSVYFNSSYLTIDNPISINTPNFSICVWLKLDRTSVIETIYTARTSVGNGIALFKTLSNNFRLDDNTQTTFDYKFTSTEWTHVCITRDITSKKLYINGNLVETKNSVGDLNNIYNIGSIGASSNNNTKFGNYFKGYMNDFRIYDHCLSPTEVKEIAKGLILHYPLKGNGFGNANLLTNGQARNDFQIPLNNTTYNVNSETQDYSGKIMTVSYDCKATDSINQQTALIQFHTGTVRKSYVWVKDNVTTEYRRFSHTFTVPDNDINKVNIGLRSTSTYANTYRNIKLEFGNKATLWCPNVSESLYNQWNLNSMVEYDASGYFNDGTLSPNPPIYDNDSPKYDGSLIFNGIDNFVACGINAKVKDEITISIWAYMEDWSTFNYRLFSCTEAGGWNIEPNNSKIRFSINIGTSPNNYYIYSSSISKLNDLTSGWHLFTATYDGYKAILYIDGQAQTTSEILDTKTPIFYNVNNGIFVGAEAYTGTTTPATDDRYFNGKLSDFRIYVTALSGDDVLDLYNKRYSIDINNVLYASEVIEN